MSLTLLFHDVDQEKTLISGLYSSITTRAGSERRWKKSAVWWKNKRDLSLF